MTHFLTLIHIEVQYSERERELLAQGFTGIKTQRFLKYWGRDLMWFCLPG